MKRSEIAKTLTRHRGAKAEVARRSGVPNNAVSMWLAGGTNRNVAEQAEKHARELLAAEAAKKEADGDVDGPSVRKVISKLRSKKSPSKE